MRAVAFGVLVLVAPACSCGPGVDEDAGAADVRSLDADALDDGDPNPIVDVTGSGSTFCARRVDGEWRCWGARLSENVPGLGSLPALVDEVASGGVSVCVVVDGRVSCEGRATAPSNPIEAAPSVALHGVAPDAINACAIEGAGGLECWGPSEWTHLALAGVIEVRGGGSNQFCARTLDDIVCFRPGDPDYVIRVGVPASQLAGQGQSVRCWLSLDGRPRCDTRCIDEVIGLPPEDCTSTNWDTEVGPLPDVELLQLEIAEGYLACGVHADHTLECWGSAYYRERTGGGSLAANTPPGELWRDIAIGDGLCGITLDGRMLCWTDSGPSTDVPVF